MLKVNTRGKIYYLFVVREDLKWMKDVFQVLKAKEICRVTKEFSFP